MQNLKGMGNLEAYACIKNTHTQLNSSVKSLYFEILQLEDTWRDNYLTGSCHSLSNSAVEVNDDKPKVSPCPRCFPMSH